MTCNEFLCMCTILGLLNVYLYIRIHYKSWFMIGADCTDCRQSSWHLILVRLCMATWIYGIIWWWWLWSGACYKGINSAPPPNAPGNGHWRGHCMCRVKHEGTSAQPSPPPAPGIRSARPRGDTPAHSASGSQVAGAKNVVAGGIDLPANMQILQRPGAPWREAALWRERFGGRWGPEFLPGPPCTVGGSPYGVHCWCPKTWKEQQLYLGSCSWSSVGTLIHWSPNSKGKYYHIYC